MSESYIYIVSDLHIGSEFFHRDNFIAWLDGLPDAARLVLNGDIIDEPEKPLLIDDQSVIARLVEESYRRSLVWVYGNHDAGVVLDDSGQIQFVNRWSIDARLLIVHGDRFDEMMPRHGVFRALFRFWHRVLKSMGFFKGHVAFYAKRWKFFYNKLNEHVAQKALREARDHHFEAVTCGHTHAAMDIERDGVRYLNTGAWTEMPHHYIRVDADGIHLNMVANGAV
jgi:UDP-2,3-diacylglucosamine pyrophosphatase LpxH